MPKRPRILILGKLPPPYIGPAIATRILLRSSLNEHYRLIHVNTNVHETLGTLGTWSFRKVWKNISVYRNLIRTLRDEAPDLSLIPISQTTIGFAKDAILIWICQFFRSKIVVQLRGSGFKNWLDSAAGPTRWYARTVLGKARGVVVLGENLRILFVDFFSSDQVFVVPNGADYQVGEDEPIIETTEVHGLYLSNLQATKGIVDVIHSMVLLRALEVEGFVLHVVGNWRDDDTKRVCQQLVQENELPVVFHGPAYEDDKSRFMKQADLFVFTPNAPEGHPWVIVEAMAFGLPIISTDQGAITESVRDGINGFIVDSNSPEQIADRILTLIRDPALRRQMGRASRTQYLQYFTEEKMVARMRNAFDTILAAPDRV